MTTEFQESEIVYLGERFTTNGKLASLIINADLLRRMEAEGYQAGGLERAASLFGLKGSQKPNTVGAIYKMNTVMAGDKITSVQGNPVFTGRGDWRDLHAWEAMHMTEKRKLAARGAEAKASKDTALQRSLAHLGRSYALLPPTNRPAFLTYVMERIIRG